MTAPLANITGIGNRFARAQGLTGGSLSAFVERSTMLTALAQIARQRTRLASLPAPPAAVRLRTLLLEVVDGQVRIAHELQKLVVFLPRFGSTLQPLGPAITRLQSVLSEQSAYGAAAVAAVYEQKAAALRSFQASLEGILAKLRRLQPPAVSEPDYAAQLKALEGMSSNAGKLAAAIAQGPSGNVQPLLTAFDRAAASAQSASVLRARDAAVRSYDRQLSRINELAQAAERERLRLADTLH
jgi:hypothetical protein